MQPLRAKPIIKDMVRNDLFLSLANDRNGLWLGSWAGGLSYYDFKTNTWSNYKFNAQLSNTGTINIAHKINFDRNGTLWVATSDKGIGTFDTATKQFDFYSDDINTTSMMPANHCNFFYGDRQNKYILDYTTLDEVEELLDPKRFFRANRQAIINIDSIQSVKPYENSKLKMTLKPPLKFDIDISREKAPVFKKWLDR